MIVRFRPALRAMLLASVALTGSALAQEATEAPAPAPAVADAADALLTDAELQTLVAPVALYPDTLLIQILVGATQPFDVMKADRLLLENDGAAEADMEALVDAEGYDESVEVLALAFPDVLHGMADHIDWTETVGDAMLVQSDDVLAAVQVMRDQAIDTGALATTEQQVVEQDPVTQTVVIQPADPEIVYVPQYDPVAVYDNSVGDAVAAGLIAFTTFAVIDNIFDDDDDWGDYWGCRNCAGWGGGPIIRDPNIDIDVDGNVNIGNVIGSGNIDRDTIRNRIETGDIQIDNDDLRARFEAGDISRDEIRQRVDAGDIQIGDTDLRARLEDGGIGDGGGWKPEGDRGQAARDKIAGARGEGGATTLPIKRPESSDALRAKLSERTGAADIARPEVRPALRDGAGAALAGGAAGGAAGALAGSRPAVADRVGNRPGGGGGGDKVAKLKAKAPDARPAVKKPVAKAKPKVNRPAAQVQRPAQVKRPAAPKIAKKASGSRTKSIKAHGKKKHGGKKLRR